MSDNHLDPMMLARVLVMPGAQDLFDAFSRIPPGPLRDSVIQHARIIADQYTGAPAQYQMVDPLLAAAQAMPPPGAMLEARERPAAPAPRLQGFEAEVVRLRHDRLNPSQIAQQLGVKTYRVDKVIAEARRAGVKFPTVKEADPARAPEKRTFQTNVDDLSRQGHALAARAAQRRGLTLEDYMERKRRSVELAQQGMPTAEIAKLVNMDAKAVGLFLSNARAVGIVVPYNYVRASEPAGEEPDPPRQNVVPVDGRYFGPATAMRGAALTAVQRGAMNRNMTVQAYLDLQESIVRQRIAGVTIEDLLRQTGEPDYFIRDVLSAGKQKGAVYPRLPTGRYAALLRQSNG